MRLSLKGKAYAFRRIESCREQTISRLFTRTTATSLLLLSCTFQTLAVGSSINRAPHHPTVVSDSPGERTSAREKAEQITEVSFVARNIQGRVTDEKNEGLPGVSIVIKGT